jgi:hypothetical protein
MIYITVVTLYVLMLLGISVYKSRSVKTDEEPSFAPGSDQAACSAPPD